MIVGLLADIVDCLFIVASKRLYAHCGSDLLYFRIHIAKATEKNPFGLCRELTEVTNLYSEKLSSCRWCGLVQCRVQAKGGC